MTSLAKSMLSRGITLGSPVWWFKRGGNCLFHKIPAQLRSFSINTVGIICEDGALRFVKPESIELRKD